MIHAKQHRQYDDAAFFLLWMEDTYGNPNVERTGNVIIVNVQVELTTGIDDINRIILGIEIPIEGIRAPPSCLPPGPAASTSPTPGCSSVCRT